MRFPIAKILALAVLLSPAALRPARAADSALVKLLKGGKVPPERQPAILDAIGKRGTADDLSYVYGLAIRGETLSPTSRVKALDVLLEASQHRKLAPTADLDTLGPLIAGDADPALRLAAVRLAGAWKVEALREPLLAMAVAPETPDSLRASAVDALVAIGGDAGRAGIVALGDKGRPAKVRALAAAALVRLDVEAAAALAGDVLRDGGKDFDPAPLVAAFLNRQGASDTLAAAIAKTPLPADAAKLALRAMYALGRTDPALVAELSKEAGIDAEVRPFGKEQLDALVAEVASKGDPDRGEAVFRRPDMNCASCHALGGAGGGIGPDLSAVGVSSPVDYLINSIILPDQAIKEAFVSLVVSTTDGQIYQGIVADRDDRRIVLRQANGELRTIPVSEIDEQKEGNSLMPKGLANLMTHDEFVDLVRFLSELGKPGPYAVRPTQSIQRWRVLKPVPDALKGEAPADEVVRSQLLGAEPASWQAAYAKVAGSLPLAELTAATGDAVVYVQGDIDVSSAGPVVLALDSPRGLRAWVDDRPVTFVDGSATVPLEAGRRRLSFRVDAAARGLPGLKVEVRKAPGSAAEFAVVGGR